MGDRERAGTLQGPGESEGELENNNVEVSEKPSVEEWTDQRIFDEIKSFLRDHVDFTDESTYTICICYALVCKRYRQFNTLPYLFFLGPPASGKSRAMLALHSILGNPIKSASMTPAVLFHVIEQKHPDVICIDESEILNDSKSSPEYLAILNSGYEAGTPAYRLIPNEKTGYELKSYDTYGPKLLAGTKEFRYPTILSRCIVVNMERRSRKVNFDVDMLKAAEIKEQLIRYGERHKDTPLKPFEPEEYGADRLAQLFYPLYQVAPSPEVEAELRLIAREMNKQRQLSEQSGIENFIVRSFEYDASGQTSLLDPTGPLQARSKDVFETFKGYWGAEYGYEAAEKWSSRGFWSKARPLGFELHEANSRRLMRIGRDRFTRLKERFCGVI